VACNLPSNFPNTKGYEADEGVSKAVKGRPFKILSPLTPACGRQAIPLSSEERGRMRGK